MLVSLPHLPIHHAIAAINHCLCLDCATRESAIFGLPGDRERILGINSTHSDMCRFDPSADEDARSLKIVLSSVEDLYEDAVKRVC